MGERYRSRRARLAALSAQLRAGGRSWADIGRVIEGQERVNARVALRLAHGWTQEQVASRWNEQWPPKVGGAGVTDKNISYWETWPQSGVEPSLKTLRRLAQLYQCDVGQLVDDGDYRHLDEVNREGDSDAGHFGAGGRVAGLAGQYRAPDTKTVRRGSCSTYQAVTTDGLWTDVGALVMAAAHESGDRAADDVGKLVPGASIDCLRGEVTRLARNFGGVSPVTFLVECGQSRDLAFQLVERTRRPGQSSDLYLIIGQLCAMMAEASFDLAVWPAVIEQAHAAALYGEMVGYPSLQAWALGMQAITAYWRGRAREAVSLAEAGVSLAPPGSPRVRLLSISARAWDHAGDAARTRSALALADQDRDGIGESGGDELHDVIGGQFAWGPARQAMSAASALLTIGDPFRAAVQAREAIRLQLQDQACQSVSVLARADLAYAELVQDHPDAAEATLAPVWELEPAQRRFGLVERLGNISGVLAGPRFARSKAIAALADRIAVFTADAAPKALPPGSTATALPGGE